MKLFLEAILGLAIAHSMYSLYQNIIQLFEYCSIKPNIQFNIVGAFATCPNTTVELSGPSGTITSPGWPGDYPNDSECYWKINCGGHGIFPKVSVHWGDVHMPIHWSEDAKCR